MSQPQESGRREFLTIEAIPCAITKDTLYLQLALPERLEKGGLIIDPWHRICVDSWLVTRAETEGSEGGEWLRDNYAEEWLHKYVRQQPNGHQDGEDWAEVAASEVGRALGVPVAETRLCLRSGRRGSLSKKVHNVHDFSFIEGKLHLLDTVGVEVTDEEGTPKKVRAGHSLDAIRESLLEVDPPEDISSSEGLTAFDVFTGYLCFDALVANRDRHEQNWAILEPVRAGRRIALAPSYDHAGAFGYNMRAEARSAMLGDPSKIRKWANKGSAWRIEHLRPPGPDSLVAVAAEALTKASEAGRQHWIKTIHAIDPSMLRRQVGANEALSPEVLIFIERVLEINQERLTDATDNL